MTKRIQDVTEKRLAGLQLPEGPEKEKRRRQIQEELKKEARRLSEGLVAKMDNVRFLRGFGVRRCPSISPRATLISPRQALVNNILVRMYHQGLEISIPEYARFKEVAMMAASKKQSLLILPCHKSHIVSPRRLVSRTTR